MFINVWKNIIYLDDGSIGAYNDTFGSLTPIQLDSRHIVSIQPFDDDELVFEIKTDIYYYSWSLKTQTYYATKQELKSKKLL